MLKIVLLLTILFAYGVKLTCNESITSLVPFDKVESSTTPFLINNKGKRVCHHGISHHHTVHHVVSVTDKHTKKPIMLDFVFKKHPRSLPQDILDKDKRHVAFEIYAQRLLNATRDSNLTQRSLRRFPLEVQLKLNRTNELIKRYFEAKYGESSTADAPIAISSMATTNAATYKSPLTATVCSRSVVNHLTSTDFPSTQISTSTLTGIPVTVKQRTIEKPQKILTKVFIIPINEPISYDENILSVQNKLENTERRSSGNLTSSHHKKYSKHHTAQKKKHEHKMKSTKKTIKKHSHKKIKGAVKNKNQRKSTKKPAVKKSNKLATKGKSVRGKIKYKSKEKIHKKKSSSVNKKKFVTTPKSKASKHTLKNTTISSKNKARIANKICGHNCKTNHFSHKLLGKHAAIVPLAL